jgi:hypothetical protein
MVMLKALRALISEPSRGDSTKKPVTKAMSKPMSAGEDYRAVSVVPGARCCSAAHEVVGQLYLFREAPRLPLGGCTTPANCSCKFKKASDRRDAREGDRRLLGMSETGRWFAGTEKRKRAGRRSAKD